jgi:hypothetical protein
MDGVCGQNFKYNRRQEAFIVYEIEEYRSSKRVSKNCPASAILKDESKK